MTLITADFVLKHGLLLLLIQIYQNSDKRCILVMKFIISV
jgi:hypothetical protein